MANAALHMEVAASIIGTVLIANYALISRVSGSLTCIEWVQGEALFAIKKTEYPLIHCRHSIGAEK